MKQRKIVISLVIVIVIVGGYYFFRSRTDKSQVSYKTAEVVKGTLVSTVSGGGKIVVSESASVNPSISGIVTELSVSIGDMEKLSGISQSQYTGTRRRYNSG